MRDDFAIFILSHGRPDSVVTLSEIERCGYTGKTYIVIDDEDRTGDEYKRRYGDRVLVFSKRALDVDAGDNTGDMRSSMYPRNAIFDFAKRLGLRWLMQFDDDYESFQLRFLPDYTYGVVRIRKRIDAVIGALIGYMERAPSIDSVCMSQGGDHIGGQAAARDIRARRKAMNSFIFRVDTDMRFVGRMNEDANLYVSKGLTGSVFLTIMQAMLGQKQTQASAGGMTEAYLDSGTYIKSFFSVMYAPSSVRVGTINTGSNVTPRIHHDINWNNAAPKIIRESHRKPGGEPSGVADAAP